MRHKGLTYKIWKQSVPCMSSSTGPLRPYTSEGSGVKVMVETKDGEGKVKSLLFLKWKRLGRTQH